MNLPCAVVRDLLPQYAEKMTEPETQSLIDEHLQTCDECRQALARIDTKADAPVESVKPLTSLKKEIRRRRRLAALAAALLVFVAAFTFFARENRMRIVPWQTALIEVVGIEPRAEDSEAPVDVLVLRADGVINGWRESTFDDEDGKITTVLQGWSSQLESDHLTTEYNEMTLYPIPDRLMYSEEGQQYLLWGEPMDGGMEMLPRLALSYYFIIAAGLALILGAAWFFLRRRASSWIPRQAFFAPLSYMIAHFLIKGGSAESFFLGRDLGFIALTAAALYALISVGWQIWLGRKRGV